MAGWLDVPAAGGVIGADLLSGVDASSFAVHVEAARTYVEDRRPDLFVPPAADAEDQTPVFTPPAHVVLAAAMLAYRTYQNRTKPEAELGDAEDLRAMLGIGNRRRMRFGAGPTVVI